MEEKERYKLESYNGAFSEIHDTELDEWFLNKQPVTELLNRQDRRIKELEKQLKQSQKELAIEVLEKMKNYFDDSEDDDKYDSEGWLTTNRSVVEYVDNQIKELKGE